MPNDEAAAAAYFADCEANGEAPTNIDLISIRLYGKPYDQLSDEQATVAFDTCGG